VKCRRRFSAKLPQEEKYKKLKAGPDCRNGNTFLGKGKP